MPLTLRLHGPRSLAAGILRVIRRFLNRAAFSIAWSVAVYRVLTARTTGEELVWGVTPLISNKYWSGAMRSLGEKSITLMTGHYSVFRRDDFDLYIEQLVPGWISDPRLRASLAPYFALAYVVERAKVLHCHFSGGPLGLTKWWRLEAWLLARAGVKTVLLPYGADAYMYSRILDPSLTNALLVDYPEAARKEAGIAARARYWVERADAMVCGIMLDGIGRWDVPVPSIVTIDESAWAAKLDYSSTDGKNGVVRVIHTPNHRGFKGTEFIINAVEILKAEGLGVELILVEKVPNQKVQELMQAADILVEQLIFTGYALSGLEGMASGLPVLSNLDNEAYTRVFRRYSFLDECPIVSATPESITDMLRTLVRSPELRSTLGRAGRRYVEKYHSNKMAGYLFGSIHRRIVGGEDIKLMDLFHPLKSDFVRKSPKIEHPLLENRLPAHMMRRTAS